MTTTPFLLVTEKPNPPSNVDIFKNNSTGVYYEYDITWKQPEPSQNYHIINYTVQTFAIRDSTYAYFCSCVGLRSSETNTFFAFNTGCPGMLGNSPLYQLLYRVATNTAQGTQSNFIPGENTSITPGLLCNYNNPHTVIIYAVHMLCTFYIAWLPYTYI